MDILEKKHTICPGYIYITLNVGNPQRTTSRECLVRHTTACNNESYSRMSLCPQNKITHIALHHGEVFGHPPEAAQPAKVGKTY